MVSVLAYSGVRPGEALGRRWRDVGRTIYVHAPKTDAARSVRLVKPLANDLKGLRSSVRRCGRRQRKRFVGTVRRECLDWILIISGRQLECVLRVYVEHCNAHRPHRSLGPAQPRPTLRLVTPREPEHVRRRDRLGGLIYEYGAAA
jgi:putative transposase